MTKLSAITLKKCALLPEKPSPITLLGRYVRLEPLLILRDAKPLFEASNGSSIKLGTRSIESYDPDVLVWRYMFDGPFNQVEDFENSLEAYVNATNGLCHSVFDREFHRQIGVANFMNNSTAHLKIELGGIWYSPIAQRTFANTETTYLMLNHAFNLGYRPSRMEMPFK